MISALFAVSAWIVAPPAVNGAGAAAGGGAIAGAIGRLAARPLGAVPAPDTTGDSGPGGGPVSVPVKSARSVCATRAASAFFR
jgi:hypothetical protein